ncbi:unnamed protein product [Toxocara canis]|uniref:START domain-containing protein n=1 Tax=Toxocara canis TaxID=6265 RepID=A0A183TY75_TOXCA|nr:unnamed protein product [Toxocara canis]
MAPIITAIAAANDASSENSDKYAEGLRKANEALRDLMELVSMPDFEQRDGWKRKNSNRSDIVFSKRYSMGKVFTMRTVFDFPLQQAFAEHWENFIDIIHYNKNISNVRVIAELSAHADVVYYAMKDFAVVKGREFLTCRTFRRIGDEIMEAARSFELPDIKRNPNKIRGDVVLAGGRFRMDPKDATKTIVDYVMCVDFKGPDIPKVIMDATIGMFIMQDADYTRKQIEKLKSETT